MMQRLMMCAVALACLVAVATGQTRQKVFKWNVKDYPDPFSYDSYSFCGRHNKSNICDPNFLITREKADKIDSLIGRVFRETRCKCPKCISNTHGYVIRVAVMPRMESVLKLGNSSEDLLRDAQMYAYILAQDWAMGGNCNESVLILFSRYDGILYTLTLPLAREVLKDEYVKRITMSVRHMFDDDDTIGDGLHEMIRRYMLVFEGSKDEALRPMIKQPPTSHAPAITSSLTITFLLSTLLMVLTH